MSDNEEEGHQPLTKKKRKLSIKRFTNEWCMEHNSLGDGYILIFIK
jgi:hypothetical protein